MLAHNPPYYAFEKQRVKAGTPYTGVGISYIKSRRVVVLDCWYDGGYGGMQPVEIPLDEFLSALEVKR